jgi:hypothetical protein
MRNGKKESEILKDEVKYKNHRRDTAKVAVGVP